MFGKINTSQKGQSLIEYILLLAMISSFFVGFVAMLGRTEVGKKMMKPITKDFAHVYQYGNAKTIGPEEPGGPSNHPREEGDGNFRIFINPRGTQ